MIVSGFVLLPVLLVAITVKVNVPAVVGVPEITPVAERFNPVGRVPFVCDQFIVAVPVAVRVWLYGAYIMPFGNVVVVIIGGTRKCSGISTVLPNSPGNLLFAVVQPFVEVKRLPSVPSALIAEAVVPSPSRFASPMLYHSVVPSEFNISEKAMLFASVVPVTDTIRP